MPDPTAPYVDSGYTEDDYFEGDLAGRLAGRLVNVGAAGPSIHDASLSAGGVDSFSASSSSHNHSATSPETP